MVVKGFVRLVKFCEPASSRPSIAEEPAARVPDLPFEREKADDAQSPEACVSFRLAWPAHEREHRLRGQVDLRMVSPRGKGHDSLAVQFSSGFVNIPT